MVLSIISSQTMEKRSWNISDPITHITENLCEVNTMETPLVEILDTNLQMMANTSFLYIIQVGMKYDIFKALSEKNTEKALQRVKVQNKMLLNRFIEVLNDLGIIHKSPEGHRLNKFLYEVKIFKRDYELILSDWIRFLEKIYEMVDYAFLTHDHPYVSMDFDKDADFWDMRMRSQFASMYRKIIMDFGEILSGSSVIDIGCGSVSPVEFAKQVGPNGYYLGIDYSSALLEVAKSRIEEQGYDWASLKEIDAHIIKPHCRYDVAIMSFVLEYLKNRQRVIKRTIESLKGGGRLIIIDPFKDSFENVAALEFFESLNKDFVGYPTKAEISTMLEEEGFDVNIESPGRGILLIKKL